MFQGVPIEGKGIRVRENKEVIGFQCKCAGSALDGLAFEM
jgi:hypothetical protein